MMLLLLKYTSLWRVPADLVCQFLFCLLKVLIREYGNTFYVGMARKNNGCPYISISCKGGAELFPKHTDKS